MHQTQTSVGMAHPTLCVHKEPALTQYSSKSKVTEFDDRVLCYQDVFWLYIPVDALEEEKKARLEVFNLALR